MSNPSDRDGSERDHEPTNTPFDAEVAVQWRRLVGEVAQLAERATLVVANNDVVDEFDLQQIARPDEIAGDADVRVARLWLARRMVVHQHDGVGPAEDGGEEYFTGMTEYGALGADGLDIVSAVASFYPGNWKARSEAGGGRYAPSPTADYASLVYARISHS